MKWKTGLLLLVGLIAIYLLYTAAAGLGQREKRENEDLICDGSRDVTVGENVTLFCRKSHLDGTDQSIVWTLNGNIRVLVYRSKGFSPDDQAEQFRGRASQGSSWNPAEGEFAVKISSFKETDAGEYTCTVGTGSKKVSCSTTLNILQPGTEKRIRAITNWSPKSMSYPMVPSVLASTMLYLLYD